MKTTLFFIPLLIAFFSIDSVFSQKSILLLTGNRVPINDYRIDSSGVILYKNLHDKIRGFENDEVFSITRADSVEVIIYQPACKDVCFQINQMRDYLNGEADGRKPKTFWYGAGNFVVGAAAGFTVPYLSPIAPAAFSTITGVITPKQSKMNIPEKYKGNPHYLEGYTKSLKRKRVLTSIVGGGVGMVVGIVVLSILAK